MQEGGAAPKRIHSKTVSVSVLALTPVRWLSLHKGREICEKKESVRSQKAIRLKRVSFSHCASLPLSTTLEMTKLGGGDDRFGDYRGRACAGRHS